MTQDPAAGWVSASGDRGLFDRIVGGIRRLFQQPTAEGPRGQISILPDRRMSISLFENADRSTFLHETGHFFLEVFGDIAAQEAAPQQARGDFAALHGKEAWTGTRVTVGVDLGVF